MPEIGDNHREYTSLTVTRSVHKQLKSLKPYNSMSFNDLLSEMADVYKQETNS